MEVSDGFTLGIGRPAHQLPSIHHRNRKYLVFLSFPFHNSQREERSLVYVCTALGYVPTYEFDLRCVHTQLLNSLSFHLTLDIVSVPYSLVGLVKMRDALNCGCDSRDRLLFHHLPIWVYPKRDRQQLSRKKDAIALQFPDLMQMLMPIFSGTVGLRRRPAFVWTLYVSQSASGLNTHCY